MRNSRGVTLGEVIVSVGILSFAIITMMGTLIGGLEAFQKATAYNQAILIAKRIVNNYQNMDYDSVETGIVNDVDGDFVIEVDISETDYGTTGINYKKVKVIITNSLDKKTTKRVKVSMITYLFPYT